MLCSYRNAAPLVIGDENVFEVGCCKYEFIAGRSCTVLV
jgi:hypothetical protein